MNDDSLKPAPTPERPLDALHNQVSPYEKAKTLPGAKPIRTYESDVADLMSRQKSSVISMSSAESDRKYAEKKKEEKKIPVNQIPVGELARIVPTPPAPKSVEVKPPQANQEELQAEENRKKLAEEQARAKIQAQNEAAIARAENERKVSAENERRLAEKAAREKLQAVNQEAVKKEVKIKEIKKAHTSKKAFMFLVSIIFITGGIMGGYYFYKQSAIAPPPVVVETKIRIPSLITPDIQQSATIPSLDRAELTQFIVSELSKYPTGEGRVLEIVPMRAIEATTTKLTATEFITAMNFSMTDSFKRALTDKWMIGSYTTDGQIFPFLILNTSFFQNAFAGMLKWESAMPDELADILDYSEKAKSIDVNSPVEEFGIQGSFSDKIIRNRDIREFTNTRGEILFLYSFLDKDTIIITTSEATIPAIVDRIDKQTYIR